MMGVFENAIGEKTPRGMMGKERGEGTKLGGKMGCRFKQ